MTPARRLHRPAIAALLLVAALAAVPPLSAAPVTRTLLHHPAAAASRPSTRNSPADPETRQDSDLPPDSVGEDHEDPDRNEHASGIALAPSPDATPSVSPTPRAPADPDAHPPTEPTPQPESAPAAPVPTPSATPSALPSQTPDPPLDGGTAPGPAGSGQGKSAGSPGGGGLLTTATGGVSVLALVAIVLAILAPAVLIYWGIRRRNRGFENMPAVPTEANTYRGQGATGHNFTVGDE